ncbi:MAG: VOC family protein [Rhodothermales bacterium]
MRINGLGGTFVFSNNPTALAQWYTDVLGFTFEGSEEFGAFYQMFFSLNPDDHDQRWDTTFAVMKAERDFSIPVPDEEPKSMYGDQSYMVNLRTDDLDALVADLEAKGITILKRADESYGKFAWIRDVDGHRIELYQPIRPSADATSV